MNMQSDVVVLGAGIVGVCTALHLQNTGRSVTLIDRAKPGYATSYGNAGLIQPDAVLPVTFPQDIQTIFSYALNRRKECCYRVRDIPVMLPVLYRYWRSSRPVEVLRATQALLPLFESSFVEHQRLAEAANSSNLFRPTGWIRAFRNHRSFDRYLARSATASQFGIQPDILTQADLAKVEPHISTEVVGAVWHRQQYSLADPLDLTVAYQRLFLARGGRFLLGDGRRLEAAPGGRWAQPTRDGLVVGDNVVVALGPWSNDMLRGFGYNIPFFVKRGYHVHYTQLEGTSLNNPVSDFDGGYTLSPMTQGIRLNTGVEFALRDAPVNTRQLERLESGARNFFPLGVRKEARPWVGSRPCLPDMIPVIGAAPRHRGLWLAFGHSHNGLTLAATTGRLVAELVAGKAPFTNPAPYRLERFN